MKLFSKYISILFFIFLFCGLVSAEKIKPVKLGYVRWSTEIASTTLVKAVIQEKTGIDCITIPMKADEMWEAVAEGEVDAIVAAWLPGTHFKYYEKYKDKINDLGPNLEGTQIGLVVPRVTVGRQTGRSGIINEPYIKAKSISDLKKYKNQFQSRIIGIDPESGLMEKTRQAIEVYGLEGFRLIEGNEAEMTRLLGQAVKKQQWIVVTGWEPHWKFGRWKLEFLDDPENVFGGKENIHTITRKGFEKDNKKIYEFLDRFYWTPAEMEQLMVWIHQDNGQFPYEKALRWMKHNKERVNSWLE
ncbi:MAG: glycine betaine ABC transporter substrate-binding protein [Desulfobacteraceae bacterium]